MMMSTWPETIVSGHPYRTYRIGRETDLWRSKIA